MRDGPDRHLTPHTQMRLTPQINDTLRAAALKYDIPVNWLVNRALEGGLPKVLRVLAQLHGEEEA